MHHIVRKILLGVGLGIVLFLLFCMSAFIDFHYHRMIDWLADLWNW